MSNCLPLRATGAGVRLSVQEEPTWGVPDPAQRAFGWEFTEESLNADFLRSGGEPRPAYGRIPPPSHAGRQNAGGAVTGLLQPHGAWPLILRHAIGGPVQTGGSYPFVHSMSGSDLGIPEGLTIEKAFHYRGSLTAVDRLRYYGCRVSDFFMRIPNKGLVLCRATFVAKEEREPTKDLDTLASYPTDNEPMSSLNGALWMDTDGGGLKRMASVQSIEFTISNGLAKDDYGPKGERSRLSIPCGTRGVSGSVQLFFTRDRWDLYRRYPTGCPIALNLSISRAAWLWGFRFPRLRLVSVPTPQTSGRGAMSITVGFEAERDPQLNTDVIATIANADPSLSTAAA